LVLVNILNPEDLCDEMEGSNKTNEHCPGKQQPKVTMMKGAKSRKGEEGLKNARGSEGQRGHQTRSLRFFGVTSMLC
tara:strand:- start:8031 stop:8261 length:231 start_codon:yes stop_codon:yes gene_type:complete